MYCYILTYWRYDGSMILPVFHDTKFSIVEFDEICQKAKDKSKKLNPYTDSDEYSIFDLYHVLVNEYGFKSLDDKVLSFNLNDEKSKVLKEDDELRILLNYSSF